MGHPVPVLEMQVHEASGICARNQKTTMCEGQIHAGEGNLSARLPKGVEKPGPQKRRMDFGLPTGALGVLRWGDLSQRATDSRRQLVRSGFCA